MINAFSMFPRTRLFFDRHGLTLGAVLFTAFCWFIISNNLHHIRVFFFLSPVNWVLLTSAGPAFLKTISPFLSQVWWVPLETVLSAGAWLAIFFVVRGIFYSITSMNVYYGMVILIVAVIVIAFIIWIILPTFAELNSWWENWPGSKPLYPGV